MRIAFIVDPLESLKAYKDSSIAMMRAAQAAGHAVWTIQQEKIHWSALHGVCADAVHIELLADDHDWHVVIDRDTVALRDFKAVLMRKDPPFDAEFTYATHLLEQAERDGARVINRPAALRNHPEKLAIMEWPQFIGPTLVTREPEAVRRFHAEHGEIILKPLDGMGGMGIFRVGPDGLNLGSITETLNHHGATTLMVQKFLPEIAAGDKRVLIIDGEPAPFVLARIPQGSEIRGNLAAGGKGVAQPITDSDRATARAIGRVLAPRGLLLIGLDIIGTRVTEINVTSPTGFREILDQTGCDVPALFLDAVENVVAGRPRGRG